MSNWWDDPAVFDPVPLEELREGCAAARMWRSACNALHIPDPDAAWRQIKDAAPADSLWHSLRNCVAYQAGVWQNLIAKGIDDVLQPAAFKMAIVLRHTPTDVASRLLIELLSPLPQGRDLTSYILALLTDDEASWSCLEEDEDNPEARLAVDADASSSETSDEDSGAESDREASHDILMEPSEATVAGEDNEATRNNEATMAGEDNEATRAGEANGSAEVTGSSEVTGSIPIPSAAAAAAAGAGDEIEPVTSTTCCTPPPVPPPPPVPEPVSVPIPVVVPSPPRSGAARFRGCAAPARDLQLFGDCELAVLAASRLEYDAHAKLVRAEYCKMTFNNYVHLRIKVLNQFSKIPKLYHTTEFECFEAAARENIGREISTLREHLLSEEAK